VISFWIFDFGFSISRLKRAQALCSLVCTLLFALCVSVEAQQPTKTPRLGILSARTADAEKNWLPALHQGLRELGYSEAKNIVIEQRYADGKYERLPALLAEFVSLKVDVLLALGDPAVHAAKKATRTIPIVMVTSPDPVGTGLVASLARPGGNLTGLSDLHSVLVTKRLELLKEVIPRMFRVAVFWNAAHPAHPLQLKDIQAAAPAFGMTVLSLPVTGADDIDAASEVVGKNRPGGLLVLGDPVLVTHQIKIIDLAAKSRLPALATLRQYTEAGGLMSYGTIFADLYRRAATYVDKILKGVNPGDLPVEQPKKFELVINLKTAKQIGLTIPPNVLARADRVIR
jgi:putative ABC transport system substrate-binding protein